MSYSNIYLDSAINEHIPVEFVRPAVGCWLIALEDSVIMVLGLLSMILCGNGLIVIVCLEYQENALQLCLENGVWHTI